MTQAQLLAYADDFYLLAAMFAVVPRLLPLDAAYPHPAASKTSAAAPERPAALAREDDEG